MAVTKLTIVTDSREKQPILFPPRMEWTDLKMRRHILELNSVTKTLEAGDYHLEGYEHITAIERKGSIEEIKNNLIGSDRRRASRALTRFQSPASIRTCLLMPRWRRSTGGPSMCIFLTWCRTCCIENYEPVESSYCGSLSKRASVDAGSLVRR